MRTEPVRKELGGRRPSKKQKNKNKQRNKSHREDRKEPYDALERTGKRSNQKRKKPQEM